MSASLPYLIHLRFNQALIIVRSIPEQEVGLQPIPSDRLKFYGFYKQATFGECNTPKPSSRNVVEYAKWKAWYRARHHSCMEAKNLYVNALVELLVEFINRYPNNQHHEFAKHALQSLESNTATTSESTDYARGPTSFIPDNHQQLPHDTTSSYFTNSSWNSKHPSTATSSVTTHPQTPILSPQLHTTRKLATHSNRLMSVVMDRVTPPAASASAATTTTDHHNRISASTTTTSSSSRTMDDHQRALLLSERNTLEKLHTEITALTEQMKQLGQDVLLQQSASGMRRHYVIKLGWRLVKTLLRHLLVNILMTGFVFWILWHQQSPTAHAMVDFLTPHIKALVRSSLKKVLFWKLTV